MKGTSICFNIAGIIYNSILCFYYFAQGLLYFIIACFFAVGVIMCIVSIVKLAINEKDVSTGVCDLIFGSFVGGILYLCWNPDEDDDEYVPPVKSDAEKLIEMKSLLDKGIIKQKEFDDYKANILGKKK